MSDYRFYTHPMTRGQIARWALHEAGADYEQVIVVLSEPHPDLDAINPMGKVPALVHHGPEGDRTVTETAAICAYLAEMHPEAGLLPGDPDMADYYRWLFFAAGPLEQAITARALNWDVPPERQGMAGFGSYQRTISALSGFLEGRTWVCGERFTMTDVYLGSHVDWGLNFGSIPPEPAFVAYAERCQARPAYNAAKAIDNALITEMKK